jgi:hypothetical protein
MPAFVLMARCAARIQNKSVRFLRLPVTHKAHIYESLAIVIAF